MNDLMKSAYAFKQLTDIEYSFTLGHKNKLTHFLLAFSLYDFHHLAGLHKLNDIDCIRGNRERVFSRILSNEISYFELSKSCNFEEVQKRIEYLYRLEQFIDDNEIVFHYDPSKNWNSRIQASFLLENEFEKQTIYFFIDILDSDGKYHGRSFFPRSNFDFSTGQRKLTLLKKEKFYLSSGQSLLQMNRLS
jgi:hypothetical protein